MSLVLDNVSVTYGSRHNKSRQVKALDSVSLTVMPGTVFGLLGPSGCGKTTLISVALGIRKPDPGSGPVKTCGSRPLYPGHAVPGPLVGYMPQDHTLHSFFAARELLVFYGRVFNVPNLQGRVTSLMKLLDLAEPKLQRRQVTKLSGGQRRRLSLACAMVHEPSLLILDEPTVGVDPVLRQTIWRHLRSLTESSRRTTVIITTHYMEECSRGADQVLFLRKGRVMGKGPPDRLKELFYRDSLDDVFLKMCQDAAGSGWGDDGEGGRAGDDSCEEKRASPTMLDFEDENMPLLPEPTPAKRNGGVNMMHAFQALLYKNLMVLRRHTTFMLFNVFMPVASLVIFLSAIGRPIHGLKVGIVNEEVSLGGCQSLPNITCPSMSGEIFTSGLDLGEDLSCHFLLHLDSFVFGQVTERTLEDAGSAVLQASDHGFLRFHEGFSEALSDRMEAIITTSNISSETLSMAKIKMSADATNAEIYRTMQVSVLRSAESFFVGYADKCQLPALRDYITHSGIAVHNVYEGVQPTNNLAHGMMPGMIAMLLQMLAMALTADQLATERQDGLFERDFVAGIPVALIMLSQITVQLIVVIGQLAFSMLLLNYVFPNIPALALALLAFLYLLQSLCGMAHGFFISVLFRRRDQVMQLGSAIVFPAFILSGILWPRIAMPEALQIISVLLPASITADVAKYVVVNDTLEVPNLYWGMAVPIIWSVTLFVATLVLQTATVISNPDVIKCRTNIEAKKEDK